jgi:hypothetical protein
MGTRAGLEPVAKGKISAPGMNQTPVMQDVFCRFFKLPNLHIKTKLLRLLNRTAYSLLDYAVST